MEVCWAIWIFSQSSLVTGGQGCREPISVFPGSRAWIFLLPHSLMLGRKQCLVLISFLFSQFHVPYLWFSSPSSANIINLCAPTLAHLTPPLLKSLDGRYNLTLLNTKSLGTTCTFLDLVMLVEQFHMEEPPWLSLSLS